MIHLELIEHSGQIDPDHARNPQHRYYSLLEFCLTAAANEARRKQCRMVVIKVSDDQYQWISENDNVDIGLSKAVTVVAADGNFWSAIARPMKKTIH